MTYDNVHTKSKTNNAKIQLVSKYVKYVLGKIYENFLKDIDENDTFKDIIEYAQKSVESSASFIDLEAHDQLLILPVPLGTDVYYILGPENEPQYCCIESTPFHAEDMKEIGVSMWATYDEAYAVLCERRYQYNEMVSKLK